MADLIDIRSIDKVQLLEKLWSSKQPAAFFQTFDAYIVGANPPGFDSVEAVSAVKNYIDYFCGRAIKSDISGDTAYPGGFDRREKEGAFKKIIDSLKIVVPVIATDPVPVVPDLDIVLCADAPIFVPVVAPVPSFVLRAGAPEFIP
jgi:hypothetical protein